MNKKELLQLCEAVERLVSDDFCQDLEFDLYKGRLCKDGIKAAERLGLIYKLVHSRLPHSCANSHENWRVETKDLLIPTENE